MIAQDSPAASDAGQSLICVKSPLPAMLEIVAACAETLLTVMVCSGLFNPICNTPKFRLEGEEFMVSGV